LDNGDNKRLLRPVVIVFEYNARVQLSSASLPGSAHATLVLRFTTFCEYTLTRAKYRVEKEDLSEVDFKILKNIFNYLTEPSEL
jgi:hypothetical protein